MTRIVVTRVPADRPGTMLLVRFGLVMGIGLMTAAGWLVLDISEPKHEAACLAALRTHYPELLRTNDGDGDADRPASRAQRAQLAPRAGFEPATNRLTAGCSTTELPGNTCCSGLPHGQAAAYIRASLPAKAEMQVQGKADGTYPDRQNQNPCPALANGAHRAGGSPGGGWRFLVAARAGFVDAAGRPCGAVGRFAPGPAIPATPGSENPALVAQAAVPARLKGRAPPLGPTAQLKEKGPGKTGPEVWVMVGCLHGKTSGRLALDG